MSPFGMEEYRDRFEAACVWFGWRKVTVPHPHERDSSCDDRTEDVWVNEAGERLFAESDLTGAMVREIIRLAGGH